MAKLTRTALKSIVKECLVEILAEGLASTGETLLESKTAQARKPKAKNRAPATFSDKRTLSENLLNKINSTTSDPILADILKDTALNTLPNQLGADKNMSFVNRVSQGDQATKVMAESDPLDMFEGASNWEALAFSQPTNSNK